MFFMDTKSKIDNYLSNSIDILESLKQKSDTIEQIFTIIHDARQNKKSIFLFGNGGSSSTASHFVCDLNKTSKTQDILDARAFSLNDNAPHIFAIANDLGYDKIFEEQLKNSLSTGDVVIAISGSGNSSNVLNAVRYAKNHNATVIGLTGFDGGELKTLCDQVLIVPSDKMFHIEDCHLIINHILTYLFTGYDYQ